MKYPAGMDQECVALCDAINSFHGLETTESCCGHGIWPFNVWFHAEHLEWVKPLLLVLDERSDWRIEVGYASGSDSIYFLLSGPYTTWAGDRLAADMAAIS